MDTMAAANATSEAADLGQAEDGLLVPYKEMVLSVTVAIALIEVMLELRQKTAIQLPKPPRALADHISEEDFSKAKGYNMEKLNFRLFEKVVMTLLGLYFLQTNAMASFWYRVIGNIEKMCPASWKNETIHSIFFVCLYFVFDQLLSIPFSLYSTFVIEQRHGFNKQTPLLFIRDFFTSILVTFALFPPLIAAMVGIVHWAGSYFVPFLFVFLLLFTLVMMVVYPEYIAPLFNKFKPLEDGSLRTKIEELAEQQKFPLKKLYQMDGSKRSKHSNAYFYGLFREKRIVLFDTLIEQCTEDQIVSVLAHELGHWKLWHTIKNMFIAEATVLLQLSVYAMLKENMAVIRAFGFMTEKECPVIIGVILSQVLLTPIGQIISLTTNVISRVFEFQADAFAVHLGKGVELKDALIVMQKENLSSINTDKWYSTYHYSHPPLPERLEAIDKEISKKNKDKAKAEDAQAEAKDAGKEAPAEETKKSQ